MGRVAAVLPALILTLALAVPAAAHPGGALPPVDDIGYSATDNVEHLARFGEHTGTAGGRVVGERFYLTDPRGVHVYDTSTPEAPEPIGFLPLPQSELSAALAQEDPDTDGSILLVDAVDPDNPTPRNQLQVVDVSDPADMTVLGTAAVTDHTWTCVTAGENRCAYAYGRTGYIVDLTDPADPQVVDRSWREQVGLNDGFGNTPYTHDLTEIRPGRVMSAGKHNVLMDTSDPATPTALTDLVVDYHMFGYHSVEWANGGADDLLVAGTEIAPDGVSNLAGSDCQGEGSWISVYDASSVRKADERVERGGQAEGLWKQAEFERLDTFHVEDRGIFLDGNAPAHTLYCAHWMELAPSFDGGGKMVVAYYDWGTRFVDIGEDGQATEIGWFVPVDGYTGSAQWITDEIVYVMDYRRGLDVLRLTDEEAQGVVTGGNGEAPDVLDAVAGDVPSRDAAGGVSVSGGPGSRAGSLAPVLAGALGLIWLARRGRSGGVVGLPV